MENQLTLVGIPLATDYRADARLMGMVEGWDRNEKIETYYPASDSVCHNRDKIVKYAEYRIPKPTHILFFDSDVVPRPNTLEKLLLHDKDIVAGVYPMLLRGKLCWSVSREELFKPVRWLPDNPFKAISCGCGVILIKYQVFEKLEWPYWKNVYAPGIKVMQEDIYFCEKARTAGFDIWCDPKIRCGYNRVFDLLSVANEFLKEKKL